MEDNLDGVNVRRSTSVSEVPPARAASTSSRLASCSRSAAPSRASAMASRAASLVAEVRVATFPDAIDARSQMAVTVSMSTLQDDELVSVDHFAAGELGGGLAAGFDQFLRFVAYQSTREYIGPRLHDVHRRAGLEVSMHVDDTDR